MMDDAALPTRRRGFLGRLAAGLVGLGVTTTLPLQLDAAPRDLLLTPSPDIERWPDGLKGKHRQLFDAVSPNDGFSFIFAHIFLMTNADASKIPEHDLNAVVVLRHAAATLAFTDPVWAKYKLGEAVNVKDPTTHAPAERNPFYHPADGALPFPDASIDKLQARGVMLGVCNVALTHLSAQRASTAGVTPQQAREEWVAALIPGITLLPSGVWGVNRAQEKGCTYCYAG
ncbi:MAG TPA: hypothetical protein VFJ96_11050 [Gemmatimonadaceae bacterium]|nr:hypothetical protein [Gemmatimonadaceae bacterium]